jgi:hypothetical protein
MWTQERALVPVTLAIGDIVVLSVGINTFS